MAEFWKTLAVALPALKDAFNYLIDKFGLPGALLACASIWFGAENRALKKRVTELSDRLIETGDRSTDRLSSMASERVDLGHQLEELSRRMEQPPRERAR